MDNVKVIKDQEHYEISYSVPVELQEDLDMYIEDCVGASVRAILWECCEEQVEDRIEGSVELYFDEFHKFDASYVQEVAECLQMLSNGDTIF